MIALISSSGREQSTDEVMDWLFFKEQKYKRISGSDFLENCFSITLTSKSKCFNLHANKAAEFLFNTHDKNSFLWFRRWYDYVSNKKRKSLFSLRCKNKAENIVALNEHIKNERMILSDWILCHLNKKNHSFNGCGFIKINKLEVLEQASLVGLNIPDTMITSSKHELVKFLKAHGRVITKALSESLVCRSESINTCGALMYTEEITSDFINKLPRQFGVSLFQSLLEKQFDLRIFFLEKNFYSMAIFSQSNTKTAVDFRRYDYNKANRCVPFVLPKELEKKLGKLLKQMDIQSASIDMVYTRDDRFVFLEINPNGQFGMVSKPCKYYLEEKIADFLIRGESRVHEK